MRLRLVEPAESFSRSALPVIAGITRDSAQLRIDQIESFRRELAQIEADQVTSLTQSQASAVADYHRRLIQKFTTRYGADASDRGRQLSFGMRLVSLAGAFSLGSSVFLIFYHFWDAFTLFMQLLLLSAAPLLTFALAIFVRGSDQPGYFSRLSAALCYACFVLNVVVAPPLLGIDLGAGQVLACSVFGLILAYGLRSRLQLCVALIGVLIYLAAWLTQMLDSPWWVFFEHPDNFILPAALILIVPAILQRQHPDFASIYRTLGTFSLFAALLILGAWPSLGYLAYDPITTGTAYQVATLIGVEAGIYVGVRYGIPEITMLSSFAFLILIFQQACTWLFDIMPAYAFFSMMSVLAIGGLYILKTLRERMNEENSQ
jgi:Predicted membrane protein (DUF2157)